MRDQVVAVLEVRAALLAKFEREDKEYAEALKTAARGGSSPPEDSRTPADQRDQERTVLDEHLWAQDRSHGRGADDAIELLRQREDQYLGDLRTRLAPAQEKRRQAEALLAQAKAEELRIHMLGRWLQAASDDDSFARQPAPMADQPLPAQLSSEVLRDALKRPWWKKREWSGSTPEVAA